MSVPCHVDWCSTEAARWAVEHWHYSTRLPGGKLATLGVWEQDRFVGAVVFGSGATPMGHRPFDLQPQDVCELVRVALGEHITPVSRVLAVATRMLQRAMPDLRLVVSFADTGQGHHGGIYQAAGWVYLGSAPQHAYVVGGRLVHPRTLYSRYGAGGQSVPWLRANVDPHARRIVTAEKHKYAKALDPAVHPQLAATGKAYPAPVV
ncbi:MAG: Mom family adenine methylcarbamoylation protein [Acidimicrobiales bacterium]